MNLVELRKHYEPLTQEEEIRLIEEAQKGNEESREKIVLHNLTKVYRQIMPYKIHDKTLDYEDFMQVGVIGLLAAIEKFDTTKGVRFGTFAHWHINRQMQILLHSNHPVFKRQALEDAHIIRIAIKKMAYKEIKEEDITQELLAEITGLSPFRIKNALDYKKSRIYSYDKKLNEDEENTYELYNLIDDKDDFQQLDNEIAIDYLMDAVNEVLNRYFKRNKRNLDIFRKYYGLKDYKPRSYRELGEEYGLTYQAIHILIQKMMKKLQNSRKIKALKLLFREVISDEDIKQGSI